jgi:hypothetical protein
MNATDIVVGVFFLAAIIFRIFLMNAETINKHEQDKASQFAQATANHWQARRRKVHFPPRPAGYYGNEPKPLHAYLVATGGVLGIVDRELIFVPLGTRREQAISLDLIRWISTHATRAETGRADILVVHYVAAGRWHMAAWEMEEPETIAEVLANMVGQPFHECMDLREDYGPAPATCVLQDVYGQWLPASKSLYQSGVTPSPFSKLTRSEGSLYLAPGWLVFDERPMFPLSHLRRIEVVEHGGTLNQINPFAQDLLRLEYAPPDDLKPRVVGFQLREADRWAEILAEHTQVPYIMNEGRKKK